MTHLQFRGLSALVIDENPASRTSLQQTLRNLQIDTATADGAENALASMATLPPGAKPVDFVLVDAGLSGLDKFEQIRKVKTIAMLSPVAFKAQRTRCEELGVAAYVMKPVTPRDLETAIMGVLRPKARDAGPAQSIPNGRSNGSHLSNLRILLTEDNPINQKIAQRLLTTAGHSVRIANNGYEAVLALEQEPFDLVFMDIQMPMMGGYEATEEIRKREVQRGKRTPIIGLTAHAMSGTREKCLQAGMDGYVSKPIRRNELWAEIENAISGHGAARPANDTINQPVV